MAHPRNNAHQLQTWGINIRGLRIARGMSAVELAALCGVSRQSVYAWELGKERISDNHRGILLKVLSGKQEDIFPLI